MRMFWTVISLSRLNLRVSVSSFESGRASFCDRRNAFSTSSRVIGRPSTTAHVSADTVAGVDVGLERQAATPANKRTTTRPNAARLGGTEKVRLCMMKGTPADPGIDNCPRTTALLIGLDAPGCQEKNPPTMPA